MSVKISKSHLKGLIKECLVEILQEGLAVSGSPINEQKRVYRPNSENSERPSRAPSNALMNAIKTEARGNSVMADILADTAMTTLPNMLAGGDSNVYGAAPRAAHAPQQAEQFNGDPAQVFGKEASSRWASLAFMGDSKKKLL